MTQFVDIEAIQGQYFIIAYCSNSDKMQNTPRSYGHTYLVCFQRILYICYLVTAAFDDFYLESMARTRALLMII